MATRNGDPAAYGELVRRYWRIAYAAAFVQLADRHRAEDAAQQGFITGYQKLASLKHPQRFASWLLTTVTRHATKLSRRVRRTPQSFSDQRDLASTEQSDLAASPQMDPVQGVLQDEEKRELRQVLGRLRPEERTLVLLRYFEGFSFAEISAMTGHSKGALRTRLHRILSRLRRQLWEYFREARP